MTVTSNQLKASELRRTIASFNICSLQYFFSQVLNKTDYNSNIWRIKDWNKFHLQYVTILLSNWVLVGDNGIMCASKQKGFVNWHIVYLLNVLLHASIVCLPDVSENEGPKTMVLIRFIKHATHFNTHDVTVH